MFSFLPYNLCLMLGFGLEEYVEQEPLHRLFCADVLNDSTRWLELWWRYGFIGPLLWHSP